MPRADAFAAHYGPAAPRRRERDRLALAISRADGADSAGVHAELLEWLGGGPDGSDRDEALVAFARRLTLAPRESADAASDLRRHLSAARSMPRSWSCAR